jgi:hypothetical protein
MKMSALFKVFLNFYEIAKDRLDGKKLWKEELRKIGLIMIGLGFTGPFINDKPWMIILFFLGVIAELLGLTEDSEQGSNDE